MDRGRHQSALTVEMRFLVC